MDERIRQRIGELLAARDAYAMEVARQLMAYDAAIGELQALIAGDDATPEHPNSDQSLPQHTAAAPAPGPR